MIQKEKPSWAKILKRRGLYYEGLIDSDDLDGILENHKKSTITSYGTRSSSKVTATKPKKTFLDNAEDDKGSGAVKNAINKSKV